MPRTYSAKIKTILFKDKEIHYREFPHRENIGITPYEFIDLKTIRSIGMDAYRDSLRRLNSKIDANFEMSDLKILKQCQRILKGVEKAGGKGEPRTPRSATIGKKINLEGFWNRNEQDQILSAIGEAEITYDEIRKNMLHIYSMDIGERLNKDMELIGGKWFREMPFHCEVRMDKKPGGYGEEYYHFLKSILMASPQRAIDTLRNAQKSRDPILQGHYRWVISDLRDMCEDRPYVHGAMAALTEMHSEGKITDNESFRFNYFFLHRPQHYAAFIIPALHPIRNFILFSQKFAQNILNYILLPKTTEITLDFFNTLYACGQIYSMRVKIERKEDVKRKSQQTHNDHQDDRSGIDDDLEEKVKELVSISTEQVSIDQVGDRWWLRYTPDTGEKELDLKLPDDDSLIDRLKAIINRHKRLE